MSLWKKILLGIGFLIFGILVLVTGSEDSNNAIPLPTEIIDETFEELESITTTSAQPIPEVAGTQEGEFATIVRVIDGDTVELESGERLRYIGIDTPETVQPGQPVGCIGPEAYQKNKELVEGKKVRLEKDVSETDRLGRLLRYVYIDDVMVNDLLVREGFAEASRYPPDIKHQKQLEEAEAFAKEMKWGVWSHLCQSPTPTATATPKKQPISTPQPTVESATTTTPEKTTSNTTTQADTAPEGECNIKGNISSNDEKIYHLPGCGSYTRTKIDPSKGEKYFCSEAEAKSAGWRKAGNC